jgi:hypothetical protein
MVECRDIGDSLKIASFNCGEQVYSCYNEIQTYLKSIEQLKLPVAEGYSKYPGHNPIFNAMMDTVGNNLGWESQPYVMIEKPRIVKMKGDLAKTMEDGTRIFIEIEIGNEASVFRDIVKFDVANKLETFDFFVFILPGKKTADRLGYPMSYDAFIEKRDFFKQFISFPMIVVEIEPENEFDLTTVSEEGELTSGWGMNQSKSFIQKYNLYADLGIQN